MNKKVAWITFILISSLSLKAQKILTFKDGTKMTITQDDPANCSKFWLSFSPASFATSYVDAFWPAASARFHPIDKLHFDISTLSLLSILKKDRLNLSRYAYFAGGTVYITSKDVEGRMKFKMNESIIASGVPVTRRSKLGINAGLLAYGIYSDYTSYPQGQFSPINKTTDYTSGVGAYSGLTYSIQTHFAISSSSEYTYKREQYIRFYTDAIVAAKMTVKSYDSTYLTNHTGLVTSKIGYRVGAEMYRGLGWKSIPFGYYFGIDLTQFPSIAKPRTREFSNASYFSIKIGFSIFSK